MTAKDRNPKRQRTAALQDASRFCKALRASARSWNAAVLCRFGFGGRWNRYLILQNRDNSFAPKSSELKKGKLGIFMKTKLMFLAAATLLGMTHFAVAA